MQLACKTILVATDFGPTAARALEYARVIARCFDAALRLLYVAEAPASFGAEFAGVDTARRAERILEDGQRRMTAALAELDENTIGQVLVGVPAEKIVEYARDHDVGLIVMGTHGRRALAHLLMGSVAERVVRTAPCPVFTVGDSAALRLSQEEASAALVRH
jgi:nucleotide-binding universal stress UspA family protein